MTTRPLCLIVDDSRVIRRMAADILIGLDLRTAQAEAPYLPTVEFCRTTVPDFDPAGLEHAGNGWDHAACALLRHGSQSAPHRRVMCTTESGLTKIR